MMKLITLLALSFLFVLDAEATASSCKKAHLYFDLGQTLVDTDTHKYKPMFYFRLNAHQHSEAAFFPSAREYLEELVWRGYKLGLLADIPGDWGVNYPAAEPVRHLPTAKVLRTMAFLAGQHPEDNASWEGQPFDWSPFARIHGNGADRFVTGRVFLPQSNAERKKAGSLALFQRAVEAAGAEGCPALFQGEQEKEMELAEKAGMIPFWVGNTVRGQFFLQPEDIAAYIRDYKAGGWRGGSK
jgi:hypothetical protein